jgi:hypothetical protein
VSRTSRTGSHIGGPAWFTRLFPLGVCVSPGDLGRLLTRLEAAAVALHLRGGPSDEHLAELLGVSPGVLARVKASVNRKYAEWAAAAKPSPVWSRIFA